VSGIFASDALLDYIQALVSHTRHSPLYLTGLSPRAGLAILRCAQAWAMMAGRAHVIPEDVQEILSPVTAHRLHGSADLPVRHDKHLGRELIEAVAIP
jgi:MoxR-like ATPase